MCYIFKHNNRNTQTVPSLLSINFTPCKMSEVCWMHCSGFKYQDGDLILFYLITHPGKVAGVDKYSKTVAVHQVQSEPGNKISIEKQVVS